MATHSGVLAWRILGTGEPGGLPSMGSHRVGHDWSDLAAQTSLFSILSRTWDWEWRGQSSDLSSVYLHAMRLPLTRSNILCILGPVARPPSWARIFSPSAAPSCTLGSQHSQPLAVCSQPSGFPSAWPPPPDNMLPCSLSHLFQVAELSWMSPEATAIPDQASRQPQNDRSWQVSINWICFPNSIAGPSRARIIVLYSVIKTEYTCVLSLRLEEDLLKV